MSRTDAHRPAWVQQWDRDVPSSIDHNHSYGRCIEETFDYARWRAGVGWQRNHRCLKHEWIIEDCPHDRKRHSPHDSPCSTIYRQWSSHYWSRRYRDFTQPYEPFEIKPHEHRIRVVHDDWPCHCDDWPETPTCDMRWDVGYTASLRYYGHSSVPKWYVDGTWNNPERVRVRDGLRNLAREYNAHGDLADGDFPNPHHRHRSSWHWD